MAIFQPTNIFPDYRGGTANGTVFPVVSNNVTQPVEISWEVNGNSVLAAFQLDFYRNNASSPLVWSTGKLTAGCPFSAVYADGTKNRFRYEISWSTWTSHFTLLTEYKMIITQFWEVPGISGQQSVVQRSASVFQWSPGATLQITTAPNPITDVYAQFRATFSQSAVPENSLEWTRWRIWRYYNRDKNQPQLIYDTGVVYGASDYTLGYDGFINGGLYKVEVSGRTALGKELSDSVDDLEARYASVNIPGTLDVSCNGQHQATKIEWKLGLRESPETAGAWSISDGTLVLPDGASITYTHDSVAFKGWDDPWGFIWRGKLQGENAELLRIKQYTGEPDIYLRYDASTRKITGNPNFTGLVVRDMNIDPFAELTLYLLPLGSDPEEQPPYLLGYIVSNASGGLLPSDSLLPSDVLLPGGNTESSGAASRVAPEQGVAENATLTGPAKVQFFQMIGGINEDAALEIEDALNNGTYDNPENYKSYVYADYSSGSVDSMSIPLPAGDLTGMLLYRDDGRQFLPIARGGGNQEVFYDYSAKSGGGPYRYQMFLFSQSLSGMAQISSRYVKPCFGAWTLIEAEYADSKWYKAKNVYVFANNLVSGAVSNNNSPGVFSNFTRYPTVMPSPQNYHSGTLTSLIGTVSAGEYFDSADLRDKIMALATTMNTLFLKNRKGDFWKVAVSGPIEMTEADNSIKLQVQAQIPWVEIGPADVSVWGAD